ncbi:2OG-Fe(II) oxygenase family protein [Janthinobacterium sp. PAMC25594]|uniref:2OG-Fe(II) oxygenase family protein n=1 Tax=Janthinobacterium sp. PAMC25594 TaxID=2861284 RepID=UPI001C62F047|nr:2OG-Fe(II) oxygenase family protein [Janthinobacterium sp. PAMC25594]QYG08883.1 hypothetical protein KY494_09130 [Janthinobacterium sp. PAMC25594]
MLTKSEYPWASAKLENDALVFAAPGGLSQALQDGFFFIDIPAQLDLSAGDLFATNFYQSCSGGPFDSYQGFHAWSADRLAEHEGYFVRDTDQVEQFFLESRFWDRVFPPVLTLQAIAMRNLGLAILRAVLAQLDIPTQLWNPATGGCLSDKGSYHMTFNHFRPSVRARGLNTHKDSGWVTVLRSLEPGLEVRRGDSWLPITPRAGTFIVNFGCAMEMLTRHSHTPVAAVAHRVAEQRPDGRTCPDRFSYALFLDSGMGEDLYQYDAAHGLVSTMPFKEFLDNILRNTYQLGTEGLY